MTTDESDRITFGKVTFPTPLHRFHRWLHWWHWKLRCVIRGSTTIGTYENVVWTQVLSDEAVRRKLGPRAFLVTQSETPEENGIWIENDGVWRRPTEEDLDMLQSKDAGKECPKCFAAPVVTIAGTPPRFACTNCKHTWGGQPTRSISIEDLDAKKPK